MATVDFKNVSKRFGAVEVIKGVDLESPRASSWCSSARPAAASPPCCA